MKKMERRNAVRLSIGLAGLCMLLGLTACRPRGGAVLQDFTQNVYVPSHAVGFEIKGAEGRQSTILKTKRPWQGATDEETALFIARAGESAPTGFAGQILPGNARRIVCMSSSYVAMLAELNATERIVGLSCLDYVSNDRVAARREAIAEVGYEGNIDYERLVGAAPDLVLLYGLDGLNPMEAKLRELGIPFVYMGDYLEENPLGKAEWVVAVGELLGDRAAGEAVFSGLAPRYEALKARVDSAERALEATAGEEAAFRPKVMVNVPYGDSWFMPADGSYAVRLIRDAGGHYLYERNHGTRSVPVDMETAMRLTAEADVWCGFGSLTTLDELKRLLPNVAGMPCVRAGRLYNDNKRLNAAGGNDYWESGIMHPDLVLRDWVKILHPELVPEAEFVYYRKLE